MIFFNGGDSFNIEVTTRVKLGTPEGTPLANTATSVITAPDAAENGSVPSTAATVTVGGSTLNWSIKKARVSPATNLKPAPNTDVGYQVDFCSNSAVGNVNLTGVALKDAFPVGAVVVNNGGATVSGSELTWNLGDQYLTMLYAGKDYNSQLCITKNYTLRYPEATFPYRHEHYQHTQCYGYASRWNRRPDWYGCQHYGNHWRTDTECGFGQMVG